MYFLSEGVTNNQPTKGFEKVANKILKQQAKLGKLQSLSVNTKSLSESVLKRLVKNGAIAIVPVTAAAIYANKKAKQNAEKWFKKQEKFHKDDLDLIKDRQNIDKTFDSMHDSFNNGHQGRMSKADEEMLKSYYNISKDLGDQFKKDLEKERKEAARRQKEVEEERKAREREYQKEISDMEKDHADKMEQGKKDWKKRRIISTIGSAAATNLPFFINAIRKGLKQEVLITAKYKYGTKVFKVYDASKYEIQSGIDKVILKSITELVARMKKNVQFPIKEDVTLEEFRQITLTESELESVMD